MNMEPNMQLCPVRDRQSSAYSPMTKWQNGHPLRLTDSIAMCVQYDTAERYLHVFVMIL